MTSECHREMEAFCSSIPLEGGEFSSRRRMRRGIIANETLVKLRKAIGFNKNHSLILELIKLDQTD